jgi:hypothetical protein
MVVVTLTWAPALQQQYDGDDDVCRMKAPSAAAT